MNIKTLANWPEGMSVGQYLRVGDIVDEDLYMHFLNVLPPQAFEHGFLQVGGACDTIMDVDGKLRNTYLTFTKARDHDGWVFMGECFNREWINRNPDLEPSKEVDKLISDAQGRSLYASQSDAEVREQRTEVERSFAPQGIEYRE